MIMDEFTEFCDAVSANTGGAGSYLLGDVIDLDSASIAPNTTADIYGSGLFLVLQVDTTFTSGGSGTYGFSLCSDAQAAIAVDGSQTTHVTTGQKALAALTAGAVIGIFPLPMGSYERYLGIVQTTAVAAATAGKINAFLTADPAAYRAYADNV
jgi:hypothetical protein